MSADRNGSVPGTSTASVTASDVILRGFVTNLERIAVGGSDPAHTGVADITIDHSDFDPTKQWSSDWNPIGGGRASGTIDVGPHNLNVDPLFRDAAAGDFSLLPDSPLIDRGSPDPLVAEEPTTDLAGNPRVVDGDGDATAIADIGAFEYVPSPSPPPPLPVASSPPTPIAPALTHLSLRPARFAATSHAAKRRHGNRPVHGTTIHFDLSRSATVSFAVERQALGRRAGGACVKPAHTLRRAKRSRSPATVARAPTRSGSAAAAQADRSLLAATACAPQRVPTRSPRCQRRHASPSSGTRAPSAGVSVAPTSRAR